MSKHNAEEYYNGFHDQFLDENPSCPICEEPLEINLDSDEIEQASCINEECPNSENYEGNDE